MPSSVRFMTVIGVALRSRQLPSLVVNKAYVSTCPCSAPPPCLLTSSRPSVDSAFVTFVSCFLTLTRVQIVSFSFFSRYSILRRSLHPG